MRQYVGTSGYAYKEWKGSFYPEKLPAKDYLGFYAKHFNSVEINNTFYRMPKPSVLEKWASEVPEGFVFVLKASRRITHIKRLKEDDKGSLEYLFEVAGSLGEKLGPVYFQTPPNMKCDLERLREFVGRLPDHPTVFEFRHDTWFDDTVYEVLRERGIALCIADSEERPGVFQATAPFGYLRLRRCDYTEDDLKAWRDRVRGAGWHTAYVFFKHEDEGRGPDYAQTWQRITA